MEDKSVTKTNGKSSLPMSISEFEKMGSGFEEATSDSYQIPMLKLLQKMTDEADSDNPAYIEGAKPGMFMNSVSKDLYDGKGGIQVIPCYYRRMFLEWIPRDEADGGKLVGMHHPQSDIVQNAQPSEKNSINKKFDKNDLIDTRMHFCLLLANTDLPEPILLSWSNSALGRSKGWMTRMQNLKLKDGNKMINAPSFSHIWTIHSQQESNSKGSWYVPTVKGCEQIKDADLVKAGFTFYETIKSEGDSILSQNMEQGNF